MSRGNLWSQNDIAAIDAIALDIALIWRARVSTRYAYIACYLLLAYLWMRRGAGGGTHISDIYIKNHRLSVVYIAHTNAITNNKRMCLI
jgi:hypothetical protein